MIFSMKGEIHPNQISVTLCASSINNSLLWKYLGREYCINIINMKYQLLYVAAQLMPDAWSSSIICETHCNAFVVPTYLIINYNIISNETADMFLVQEYWMRYLIRYGGHYFIIKIGAHQIKTVTYCCPCLLCNHN